ncbi:MAG: cyclase family protein [Euzebyales bacterium]|jgi:kynurenine formamidase|nr:cyclase family protein [Euzebyales bacterium]
MAETVEPVGPGSHDEELIALLERVSNAGRWGPDDELGTLNYITPGKRVQAAALVQLGEVLSLSYPLVTGDADHAHVERRMLYNMVRHPVLGTPPAASDHLAMEVHQQGVTHLDCVSHVGGWDGRVYNGRRFHEVATQEGLAFGSISAQREGIVSRGVLLDVAAAAGVEWLPPTHEIAPADLDAAERLAGVLVSSGDVVVIRAGMDAREAALGPDPLLSGPGPAAAEWLHEREVAVYTGDAPEHITPVAARILGRMPVADEEEGQVAGSAFPLPFHQIAIPAMGLVLLDHARVEELALRCRGLQRYEFLFMAAPLVLPGGSGSPVNPLAVF